MAAPNIPELLEKLNGYCTKVFEHSVGTCVSRTQYEVRWEHLLHEAISLGEGDVSEILQHYKIDSAALQKAVQAELETLKTGNTGKPSFSPQLLEVLQSAWSIASLQLHLPHISSGSLLIAALERGVSAMTGYYSLLQKVQPETLKENYESIVKQSSEWQDLHGFGGSEPGENAHKDVLEKYCTNFTEQARSGKIDPILGRDEEIRQALDILNRRRKNNPILVGEAGVGKTAIVEGIALRIAAGDVPAHLQDVDLWGLDLGLLQAGASVKGEFEKRLKAVIDAIKSAAAQTVLFIDEAHTLIGAGGSAGQNDAANLLKPALARGELRTLAATTWSEYRKYFEKDPALARRFQLVKIEEPTVENCSIMLRGIAKAYENHHNVRISYEAIKASAALSDRYITGRQLPDKAVDVLDTACARVRMSQTVKPAAVDYAERALQNAQLEKQTLQRDSDAALDNVSEALQECEESIQKLEVKISELSRQWEEEKALAAAIAELQAKRQDLIEQTGEASEIENLQQELDEKTAQLRTVQGENPMVFPFVSPAVIAQVIGDWTGIPLGSMLQDEAQTLLELQDRLCGRIIGQDEALSEIANSIRASKTGMRNPDAPLGVFLFAGPSGVGKTETAIALAEELFGGEKFMTVINMSEYQEKHTVSQLKGAPAGYVGYGEGGILTEAVRQKPYSIVILDEVEKAHLEVMNLFYQVFDKGFMRDGEGREINFRNTLIIMTSNLGSDTIIQLCRSPQQQNAEQQVETAETQTEEISEESQESVQPSIGELIEEIRPELTRHFKPALLARAKIIPFKPLDTEVMRGVVAIKLDKIAKRLLQHHKLQFSCAPQLIDSIAAQCTAVEAGARNADAVIDSALLPAISRQILLHLADQQTQYTRVHIGQSEDGEFEIIFATEDEVEASSE